MRHTGLILFTFLAAGAVVLGPNLWAPTTPLQARQPTITIPSDSYVPAAIVISVGETVTWINKDSDKHTAVTLPEAPEAFTLAAYPGKSVTHKFTKPGVYAYYCQEHATYDSQLRRAVARKESDAFPIAMEGIIVVKGPGFTGGPSASVNVSGGAFSPDVVVVQAGGKVTWMNADADRYRVTWTSVGTEEQGGMGGAGAPRLDLGAGKSQTATFGRSGVYLFYCDLHATYNTKLGLAAANKGTRTFPVSMEGYVIVL